MRHKLICLTILSCPLVSVQAQTSVSLYGIADAGVQISRFGNGTQFNLASGQADGSRLGVKGKEDLGRGYFAIFNVEARVEMDTGAQSNGYVASSRSSHLTEGLPAAVAQALSPSMAPRAVVNPEGALFDRTSYVGMVAPIGAMFIGRQYTPAYEIVVMGDAFEAGTAAGWGQVLQGAGGFITSGVAIRASNALQYRVESSGVGAALMAGLDKTGSLNLSKRFYGGNLRFKNSVWNLGIAYQQEQDQNGRASLSSLLAGGAYTIGNAKLFAGYARMRNDNSAVVPLLTPLIGSSYAGIVGSNAKMNSHSVTFGAQHRHGTDKFSVAVSHTRDTAAGSKVTLYGVGYHHDLSKRTDIYTVLAYAKNFQKARYALGGAGSAGGFTSQEGHDARVAQLGVRHRW